MSKEISMDEKSIRKEIRRNSEQAKDFNWKKSPHIYFDIQSGVEKKSDKSTNSENEVNPGTYNEDQPLSALKVEWQVKSFEENQKDISTEKMSYDGKNQDKNNSEDDDKPLSQYGSSSHRQQLVKSEVPAEVRTKIREQEIPRRQKSSRVRRVLLERLVDSSDSCSSVSGDERSGMFLRNKDCSESEDSDWEPRVKKKKTRRSKPKTKET